MTKAWFIKPFLSLRRPDSLNKKKWINISSEGVLLANNLFPTARQRILHSNVYRYSLNTWGTWEKRTSGMSSWNTPASVAGEKRRRNAEQWSDPKKKKKHPREEFPETRKPSETECCKVAKGELRNKSEQRCLTVNQLRSTLLIYLGADRFLHR